MTNHNNYKETHAGNSHLSQTVGVDTRFFALFSLCITSVVFGGFALNWLSNPDSLSRISLWTGLHAAFSAAWYLLLLNQIRLSAAAHYRAHKTLGIVSVALVIGILFTGSIMAFEFFHRLAGIGVFSPEDAEARIRSGRFLGGAFLQWLIFVMLYILGIMTVKYPDHHKRFMLAAAIQMMPEGLNRVTHLLTLPGYSMFIFMFVIYIILMAYDVKTQRRVYLSTLISITLFICLVLAMNTVFTWQVWGDWVVTVINRL